MIEKIHLFGISMITIINMIEKIHLFGISMITIKCGFDMLEQRETKSCIFQGF